MSLGKSGEFLVEQGIIQTYLSKKYYTEWIKPPNPEEDKKEEEVKEVVQYLKGKYQVKFSG
jgi:glutathione S-transferase